MICSSQLGRPLAGPATLILLAALTATSCSAEQESKPMTFTYKKVGDLEIKADVYRPDDDKLRPVVVWIHGGALIMGHREQVSGVIKKIASDEGYVLVSLDYRLAPETQLPEVISDLEDAFTWIREQGPKLFHADTKHIIVAGGSAGGYLTLTAGFRANPRPTALVAFWGYGDLVGDWYSKPSPHPRHKTNAAKEEAFKQVAGPPISDSRDRNGDGGMFYQYCRQTGTWPKAVSGWDPADEAKKFFPYMAVKNVTPDFPPTLLLHGTVDTDVPYEQSVMMEAEFKKHGVAHELISIEGGEHGLAGADPQAVEAANEKVRQFIKEYATK